MRITLSPFEVNGTITNPLALIAVLTWSAVTARVVWILARRVQAIREPKALAQGRRQAILLVVLVLLLTVVAQPLIGILLYKTLPGLSVGDSFGVPVMPAWYAAALSAIVAFSTKPRVE